MFLFWNQFGPYLGTFYKSSVRTIAVIIFADLYDFIFDHMTALIDVILAKLGICCHVSGRIKVVPVSFDALPSLCRVGAIHIPVFCALGGLDKFRFVFFADCHARTVFVDVDIVVVHPAASGHLAIFHQVFVTDPLACQHGTALREEVAIAF